MTGWMNNHRAGLHSFGEQRKMTEPGQVVTSIRLLSTKHLCSERHVMATKIVAGVRAVLYLRMWSEKQRQVDRGSAGRTTRTRQAERATPSSGSTSIERSPATTRKSGRSSYGSGRTLLERSEILDHSRLGSGPAHPQRSVGGRLLAQADPGRRGRRRNAGKVEWTGRRLADGSFT